MNMLLRLPQQSPKGELFGKFCDCLVRSYKKLMVESYRPSAKHQVGSFHEAESNQVFLKDGMFMYQILQTSYVLFHFNRIKIFNLSL